VEAAANIVRDKPKPSLEAQDRKVQYLHFGPDELLDYDGDVTVSAALGQYRPRADDHALLETMKSSQLRVDFVQTKERKEQSIAHDVLGSVRTLVTGSARNRVPGESSFSDAPVCEYFWISGKLMVQR
jgi:hypothetical protein